MRVRIYSTNLHTTAFVDNNGPRGDNDYRIPLDAAEEYEDFVEFLETYFVGNLDHTYETDDPKIISMFLLKFR